MVSPGVMPITLKNVLAVTKQVKKFPALPSIDAVDDAILADTTLPKAEPVTIIEPVTLNEPVIPNEPVINALPVNGNEVPAAPFVPEVPEVPADKLEPDIIYIVLASVVADASNAPKDDDGNVTIFVTAGTVVYVSYMFEITLPL